MAKLGEILVPGIHDGQFGQDRHAVIALLPPRHHVAVAQRLELREGDTFHRAFAFLQAMDVGRLFGQQPGNEPFAQADRVDVPGGKGKGHGSSGGHLSTGGDQRGLEVCRHLDLRIMAGVGQDGKRRTRQGCKVLPVLRRRRAIMVAPQQGQWQRQCLPGPHPRRQHGG